jgi:hypothetical protein
LSQIKTCPLCGQSLEGVHLHEWCTTTTIYEKTIYDQ